LEVKQSRFDVLRSAHGRGFTLGKLSRGEINTDVLAVIDEGARNHHPKEVIALGYNIKVYYSQIYLLDSNFIPMILGFQLSCMKSFEIPHLMHVSNPTQC
jgi:hypothetical protein